MKLHHVLLYAVTIIAVPALDAYAGVVIPALYLSGEARASALQLPPPNDPDQEVAPADSSVVPFGFSPGVSSSGSRLASATSGGEASGFARWNINLLSSQGQISVAAGGTADAPRYGSASGAGTIRTDGPLSFSEHVNLRIRRGSKGVAPTYLETETRSILPNVSASEGASVSNGNSDNRSTSSYFHYTAGSTFQGDTADNPLMPVENGFPSLPKEILTEYIDETVGGN